MNPSTWVNGWARIKPDADAVVLDDHVTTWRDLDEQASWYASVFTANGVAAGDRVACLMRNRSEYVYAFIGALRAGAVFVPLNALAPADELAGVINDCGATVVVLEASYEEVAAALRERVSSTFVSVDEGLSVEHVMIDPLPPTWSASDYEAVDRDSADLMCIYYTSGTTGAPKGAMISYSNVHFATLNWLVDLGFWQDDKFLLNMPLCFTGAMAIMAPALHGGIAIHLHRSFDPGAALEAIEEHGITFTVAVPTMALAMMRHPDFASRDLSSLRLVLCGAAPISMSIFDAWTARGITFISSFGMTEVAGGFAMITPAAEAAERLGSAGRDCLYTRGKVVGPDGAEAAHGEVGELLIQGPLVFQGYWGKPEETARALVDGWLHTGDLATRDESGYYFIVDRMKDMIITGGLNVYPAEVEKALIAVPGVMDCAVYGVADDHWGERVVASVVVGADAPTPERIQASLREMIAVYKVPKEVRVVDALPRTTSGKVQRRKLRDAHQPDAAQGGGMVPA
jgi:fatty-acyl-CoA synthase